MEYEMLHVLKDLLAVCVVGLSIIVGLLFSIMLTLISIEKRIK